MRGHWSRARRFFEDKQSQTCSVWIAKGRECAEVVALGLSLPLASMVRKMEVGSDDAKPLDRTGSVSQFNTLTVKVGITISYKQCG
jgi:hypothetical protein